MTHSNLCLIPARAGSKRLPGKNTFYIDRVIQTAKASNCFDSIVVSTNCPRCKKIAFEEGVEMHPRSTKCARDDSTLEQFLQTFIHEERAAARHWSTITLILATAALLTKEDIQQILKTHKEEVSSITMAVTKLFHPIQHIFQSDPEDNLVHYNLEHYLKKEFFEGDSLYVDAGSIYVINPTNFLKTKSFYPDENAVGCIMPKQQSIDLDDEEDLKIMEALLND